MDVYFAPLACSLATRIALDEAQLPANFHEVDPLTRRTIADGADYRAVHPLGLVPTLRTDGGELLTENAAVLQYVADRAPGAGLAPTDALGRARLQQWLSFIGTELHKGLFAPLFDRHAPEAVKAFALEKGAPRLALLNQHLTGREWLLDGFTVADAFLSTVLNWTAAAPVDLAQYPALAAYLARARKRPSVARAIALELPLYRAELDRLARDAAA
jgi:glutathione S-transferase